MDSVHAAAQLLAIMLRLEYRVLGLYEALLPGLRSVLKLLLDLRFLDL